MMEHGSQRLESDSVQLTAHDAMKLADKILGSCAACIVDFRRSEILPQIKEAQRRLRQHTNPEMFDEFGNYK